MRLNKYIAESGFCSRRKADKLIEDGKVMINGKTAKIGQQVTEKDKIFVNGNLLTPKSDDIFVAFHKPFGAICTSDPDADNTIYDYLGHDNRLLYIGRLDVESSGLMLLTNNGNIANKISSPKFEHEKEYIVTVSKPVNRNFLEKMRSGVDIDKIKTKPALVKRVSDKKFKITLTEGKNRQIRKMCEKLKYEVTSIRRIRIMNVKLGTLGPGNSRDLTKTERRELLSQI